MILDAFMVNIATVSWSTTFGTRVSGRLGRAGALLSLVLWGLAPVPSVRADPYDPTSGAWDGLSTLVEMAHSEGIEVTVPSRIDPSDLLPRRALVIVAPATPLPRSALVAFVERGGRMLVADDTGGAAALLQAFGVAFDPDPPALPPLLEGSRDFPIALPGKGRWHPLLTNVDAVVTNQPAAVHHPRVRPLLGLGPCEPAGPDCSERPGILLSGIVGKGRMVALADPSAIIDGMQRFMGNRNLLRAILLYLTEGGRRHLLLAPPSTSWTLPDTERLEEATLPPLTRFRRHLAELGRRSAPLWLLRALALALTLMLAALALSRMRPHDPYRPETMLPPPEDPGGMAGRLAFHAEHPDALAFALQTWERSLRRELARTLGLRPQADTRELLATLTRRDPGLATKARDLFLRMTAAIEAAERGPGHPRLSPRGLQHFVRAGKELLDEADRSRPSWERAPRSGAWRSSP